MKIYLHIGTEKTGTTSIQSFLADNRDELLKKGILYSKSLGFPNNINLAIAFQGEKKRDDLRIRANIFTTDDIRSFQDKIYEDLKEEIASTSAEVLIVSSEHLSSRLNRPEEIERLYKFLCQFSDEIKVVVYLRRQDNFYESLYSTAIKSGNVFEFSGFKDKPIRHDFRYFLMINKWKDSFDKGNIIIRLFDKKYLYKSDVVEDFIHTINLPIMYEIKNVKKENLSLGRKKLEFLKVFNQYVPEINDQKVNLLRGNIVNILENMDIEDGPIQMREVDRLEFLSKFEQGNRMIAKEYFDRENELFYSASSDKKYVDVKEITINDSIEMASILWKKKQQENLELKNENLYLKCVVLLEKNLTDEASELIVQYVHQYPNHSRGYYLKARLSYSRGDHKMAIVESKRSIEMNPSNPEFQNLYKILEREK